MPRQARLDAPDTLHHVMVRGLERGIIFRDDTDRADFISRLAALAEQGAWTLYAWALLPNHAHLLLRTGTRPLAHSMRSLLTGYAGAFNRRHHRVGHLFQNRYRSIVVELGLEVGAAEAGVKGVAQAVAELVEGQDRNDDGKPWKNN